MHDLFLRFDLIRPTKWVLEIFHVFFNYIQNNNNHILLHRVLRMYMRKRKGAFQEYIKYQHVSLWKQSQWDVSIRCQSNTLIELQPVHSFMVLSAAIAGHFLVCEHVKCVCRLIRDLVSASVSFSSGISFTWLHTFIRREVFNPMSELSWAMCLYAHMRHAWKSQRAFDFPFLFCA